MVFSKPFKRMAGTTGLEPAASAVTGQRSNQLNYVPNFYGNPRVSRLSSCSRFAGIALVGDSVSEAYTEQLSLPAK
jgi:hypothetical protein